MMLRAALILALLGFVGLVVVFIWRAGADGREQDAARQLWESREPESYAFTYETCEGMCSPCPWRVSVKDGRAVEVTSNQRRCKMPVEQAFTIEDLFDKLSYYRRAREFGVSYDKRCGFPVRAYNHCGPGTDDCGSAFEISAFAVN